MRVDVIPTGGPGHALSTFLIDGVLAIDAGGLGWAADPPTLAKIAAVLLTHSHLDHIAGLPVFLDTVYTLAPTPPAIYALSATLDALRTDVFNDRLMPDFVRLSEVLPPFLTLHPITVEHPFRVGRYTITARMLLHGVPTVAYLVDDGAEAVAVVTDTDPVPAVMDWLADQPRLGTVYLEASFPDAEVALARASQHLTAAEHVALGARLPAHVAVVPVHVKPRFAAEVARDLARHRLVIPPGAPPASPQ